MSEFEKELVSLVKFRPSDYKDRQDYLAALARHADKWFQKHDRDQTIFDGLDDDLVNWFDGAITAMNSRPPSPIPDFPDLELEPEGITAEELEDDESDGDESGGEEAALSDNPTGSGEGGPSNPEVESVEEQAPKARKPRKTKEPTRYDDLDGSKDRYGITIGTKTHEAVKMFEKGATGKEIDKAIGGAHFNILRKLAKEGHVIERQSGGIFKITHKDDLKGKGK